MLYRVLLVYDIVEDRARFKIAEACKDYGLDRVQYSAFTGLLSRNQQESLMIEIESLLGDGDGNIKLIPINSRDWDNRLEVEHA
jgi:CRISPR-associated protein Cas2